ncbi:MAG: hypothetical protein WC273_07510 [Dehalococcoidia bacterium]
MGTRPGHRRRLHFRGGRGVRRRPELARPPTRPEPPPPGARSEAGQGLVEYAIVLGVLVTAFFIAWTNTDLQSGFEGAIDAVLGILS